VKPGPEPDAAYRPCVGIALFNRAGLVFIGRRAGFSGDDAWQMPQGGIDPGETPRDAAVRELAEETGVTQVSFLAEAADWLSYDLPPDLLKSSWRGRYRGQVQKWFAFRFEGKDAHINILAPPGGNKAEFAEWRWERLARTPELIVAFKRPVYGQVVKLFAGFSN
jgi:putative (di)nucleoside polyphosphate hydrolase